MPFIRALTVGDTVLHSLGRILRPGKWAKIERVTNEIRNLVSKRCVVVVHKLPSDSVAGRVQELLRVQEGNREGAKEKARVPVMVADPVDRLQPVDRRQQHPQRSEGSHLPVVEKKQEPVVSAPIPVSQPVVSPAVVPVTKSVGKLQKDSKGRYVAGTIGNW